MREIWDDWKWSVNVDPFEHLLTLLVGWAIGLFLGGSIMWGALATL